MPLSPVVTTGLDPVVHVASADPAATVVWMTGSGPAMTTVAEAVAVPLSLTA